MDPQERRRIDPREQRRADSLEWSEDDSLKWSEDDSLKLQVKDWGKLGGADSPEWSDEDAPKLRGLNLRKLRGADSPKWSDEDVPKTHSKGSLELRKEDSLKLRPKKSLMSRARDSLKMRGTDSLRIGGADSLKMHGADSSNCPKCDAASLASDICIGVFEWPLPNNIIAAKVAVFELKVPEINLVWRRATLDILLENFRHPKVEGCVGLRLYHPLYDPVIQSIMRGKDLSNARYQFRSRKRSLVASYRETKAILEATSKNICVQNRCNYHLYHVKLERPVQSYLTSLHVSPDCSYPPTTVSKPLKSWILGTSHSLNEVIANQIDCPATMSLEEFKAFGNMRAGVLLQWPNILSQLTFPALNFNKPEILFLILQAANEAGPRTRQSSLRDSHDILEQEAFGKALLDGLDDGFSRIRENWESDISLSTILSPTTRLLSVSPSLAAQERCLEYLADIRHKSIYWARALLIKLSNSDWVDERQDINHRALMMALICHGTFDVGAIYLPLVLGNSIEASLLFEASMIVAENAPSYACSPDPILMIFLHRWHRLSYEAELLLRTEIVNNSNPCLDMAIKEI
jgi:hypothetical protein